MQDYFGIFEWLSSHIHVAGWLVLLGLAWKASGRWKAFTSDIATASIAAKESHETINRLAINHLPHLQEGIDKVDASVKDGNAAVVTELKDLSNKLFQVVLNKRE